MHPFPFLSFCHLHAGLLQACTQELAAAVELPLAGFIRRESNGTKNRTAVPLYSFILLKSACSRLVTAATAAALVWALVLAGGSRSFRTVPRVIGHGWAAFQTTASRSEGWLLVVGWLVALRQHVLENHGGAGSRRRCSECVGAWYNAGGCGCVVQCRWVCCSEKEPCSHHPTRTNLLTSGMGAR